MQHEIIMGLLGCPGDLINRSPHKDGQVGREPCYKVDQQFNFLSQAERQAIDQVISLGASYEVILSFVDGADCFGVDGYNSQQTMFNGGLDVEYRINSVSGGGSERDGLFGRALKDGLEEQLNEYRDFVVKCEEELMKDDSLPISHIKYKLSLNHFNLILPALSNFIISLIRRYHRNVNFNKLHQNNGLAGSSDRCVFGSQILELLHEGISTGPVPVSRSFQRLASYCHGVLFKLCSSWTLHGRLLDPFNEFFVVRGGTTGSNSGSKASSSGGVEDYEGRTGDHAHAASWDSWASPEWDMAPWNFSHVTSMDRNNRGVAEEDWNRAFILRIDAIPLSLLPTTVAQQILFIGKAVRTLNRGNDMKIIKTQHAKAFMNTLSRSSHVPRSDTHLIKPEEGFENDDNGEEEEEEDENEVIGLTALEVDKFEKEYNKLARYPKFQLLQFESLIRKQHQAVAEKLWRLVVIKGNLLDHLQNVRDLVLMGSGELWHEIVCGGRTLLTLLPNNKSEGLFKNGPLNAAIRQCGYEDQINANDQTSSRSMAVSSRLLVSLALETFAVRNFESTAGFRLSGCAVHNREGRSVTLVSPQPVSEYPILASEVNHQANQKIQGGCLMSLGKKKVRRSFSSMFKFSWNTASGSAATSKNKASESNEVLGEAVVRICFVLSNDSKGNNAAANASASSTTSPQALGATQSPVTSKNSYLNDYSLDGLSRHSSASNQACFLDGVSHVANSLAVVLEMNESGAKLVLKKSGDVSNAALEPQVLDETRLPRRPLANTGHWLLVEYEAMEGGISKLRVYLDDPKKHGPPTLTTDVSIHKSMALDISGGDSAHVKIISSVSNTSTSSKSPLPLTTVSILDWDFGMFKETPVNPLLRTPSFSSAPPGSPLSSASASETHSAVAAQCEKQLEAYNAWDELCCGYRVDWPLRLIISEESEEQYNKIFQLLWPTKRTQVELELIWPQLMESRYRNLPTQDNVWLRPLQTLQGQMLFFVKNVQTYLQVDVVEAEYKRMVHEVQQHRDFDSVRRAHATYLTALLSKSHVHVRPLMDGIKRMLKLCRKFTLLFNAYSNAADIPHSQIADITEQFCNDGAYLFLMLERTDAKELAARLDYNGWFSNTARSLTGQ